MKEYILVGIDESQDKYNREKQLKSLELIRIENIFLCYIINKLLYKCNIV